MTVMFQDVHNEINSGRKSSIENLNFSEIFYADDTLIFGRNPKEIEKILHAAEKHSARYGMKLNRKKCITINMNNKHQLKFKDGTITSSSFLMPANFAAIAGLFTLSKM